MAIRRKAHALPAECKECYDETCQYIAHLTNVIKQGKAAGNDMADAEQFLEQVKEWRARVGAVYYPELLAQHLECEGVL